MRATSATVQAIVRQADLQNRGRLLGGFGPHPQQSRSSFAGRISKAAAGSSVDAGDIRERVKIQPVPDDIYLTTFV